MVAPFWQENCCKIELRAAVEKRPYMKNHDLKVLGMTGKAIAIIAWLLVPWLLGRRHNDNIIFLTQNSIQAFLSIVPNRWLVFSRSSFCVFLTLALLPLLDVFIPPRDFTQIDFFTLTACLLVGVFLFAPLPLSLIFSRIRFCRGEKFLYV
jgi:hypothetical protein